MINNRPTTGRDLRRLSCWFGYSPFGYRCDVLCIWAAPAGRRRRSRCAERRRQSRVAPPLEAAPSSGFWSWAASHRALPGHLQHNRTQITDKLKPHFRNQKDACPRSCWEGRFRQNVCNFQWLGGVMNLQKDKLQKKVPLVKLVMLYLLFIYLF